MVNKVIFQAPANNTVCCVCHYIHLYSLARLVNSYKQYRKWAHQVYFRIPPWFCWHGRSLLRGCGGDKSACHPRNFLQCLSTMQFIFGQHTLLWKQSGLCLYQQGRTTVSSTSSTEECCHCEWCCIDCYHSRSYLCSLVAPSQGEAGIFVKRQRQSTNFGPESRQCPEYL